MIKKYFSLFILTLFFCLDVFAQNSVEDFGLRYNEDGGLILYDYTGVSKSVNIPPSYGSYDITEIFGGMFTGAFDGKNITSVYIPETIKIIGRNAFLNNDLAEITLGSGLELDGAFAIDFEEFYKKQNRTGGKYLKANNGNWTFNAPFLQSSPVKQVAPVVPVAPVATVAPVVAAPQNKQSYYSETQNSISINIPKIINPDNTVIHIATKKESLTSIAGLYYGKQNAKYFPLIMLATGNIDNPDKIRIGDIIVIPDITKNKLEKSSGKFIKEYFLEVAKFYGLSGNKKLQMLLIQTAQEW